jgi:hypothetical protein
MGIHPESHKNYATGSALSCVRRSCRTLQPVEWRRMHIDATQLAVTPTAVLITASLTVVQTVTARAPDRERLRSVTWSLLPVSCVLRQQNSCGEPCDCYHDGARFITMQCCAPFAIFVVRFWWWSASLCTCTCTYYTACMQLHCMDSPIRTAPHCTSAALLVEHQYEGCHCETCRTF